jgi:hypothetical protein
VSYTHEVSGLTADLDVNVPSTSYTDVRTGIEWNWNQHVAVRAVDPQAIPAHCLQVCTARDEMHLFAAGGKLRAEVSTDTSGSHYCNFHLACPPKFGRMCSGGMVAASSSGCHPRLDVSPMLA